MCYSIDSVGNDGVVIAIIEALENVWSILVVLEVLQEGRLASRKLGELNANFAVVDLENADANVNNILDVVLEVVRASDRVLDLVLVFFGLDVEVLVLKVVDERLLNHVWVVGREEFGVVVEYTLILI